MEPVPSFTDMVPGVPVGSIGCREAHGLVGSARVTEPIERRAEIVVVGGESI